MRNPIHLEVVLKISNQVDCEQISFASTVLFEALAESIMNVWFRTGSFKEIVYNRRRNNNASFFIVSPQTNSELKFNLSLMT